MASAHRVSSFSNVFSSRMWKIAFWFTRSRGGISSRLSNRIFRYKIRVLLSCFLPKSISFFIICNSWVEFFYSVHISYWRKKMFRVFVIAISIFITVAKAYLFLFIPITTRWTLPRMRMDQLWNLGWKFLLPISLGNLLLTTSFQLVSP